MDAADVPVPPEVGRIGLTERHFNTERLCAKTPYIKVCCFRAALGILNSENKQKGTFLEKIKRSYDGPEKGLSLNILKNRAFVF